MPGIGVRTGARILIEGGDGSTFPTAAHLAAYAGLAPATRSSGSSIRGEQPSRRRHPLRDAPRRNLLRTPTRRGQVTVQTHRSVLLRPKPSASDLKPLVIVRREQLRK
ncbi:IS110 family transposase [Streptomyces sp. NPDC085596]|uniref:IS110 family transposase n=1 Tax=Streptomyces sp. NPDC085596 TaxID=3365731 RepID=UPI0037D45B9A